MSRSCIINIPLENLADALGLPAGTGVRSVHAVADNDSLQLVVEHDALADSQPGNVRPFYTFDTFQRDLRRDADRDLDYWRNRPFISHLELVQMPKWQQALVKGDSNIWRNLDPLVDVLHNCAHPDNAALLAAALVKEAMNA